MRPPLGTLRAALAIALEEKMLDGQDPAILLQHCTRTCLDATVLLEVELRVRATSACSWVETGTGQAQQRRIVSPTTDWPAVLVMRACLVNAPFKESNLARCPCYVFARRLPSPRQDPQYMSRFHTELSRRRLSFVMKEA